MKRIFRKLFRIALILLLLPYFIVLVYAVVPPISIPIIGDYVTFKKVNWQWRSNEKISHNLARAIITGEDQKFCMHHGIDWKALAHVIKKVNEDGDYSSGGSTINMQVAKNLFLWPLPKFVRKPLEIPLALWTDLIWSKKRTMEIYMNIAEFGDGVYGAEAGAKHYFNKSAYSLTPYEASMLTAILPNPEYRSASHPNDYVRYYSSHIRAVSGNVDSSCTR